MIEPEDIIQKIYSRITPTPGDGDARVLVSRYADATTLGTTRETLYHDIIEPLTLERDGDTIHFRYSGLYVVSIGDDRSVFLSAFGTDIADSGALDAADVSGKAWELNGVIIRVSNTVVRCQTTFLVTGIEPILSGIELTGLDLVDDPYDLDLEATTADSAGDVTASLGTAWFVPAAV